MKNHIILNIMKHRIKLIRQFAYLISIFVVTTIAVSALVTYFSQVKQYHTVCKDRIMSVGDYLAGLIMEEPDDFLAYKNYYEKHYEEIRIPFDFSESATDRDKFYSEFLKVYPGQTFFHDVMPDEMSDELQLLYYTWRHEYWILIFEQARDSFNLPYTYFLLPDEKTNYTMYMIDGERTEDKEHPGFLYMGDSYYEDPAKHELLWNTYLNGKKYDDVYEWNNEWGHTYSYYTPLVIHDECVGLIVSEIKVGDVNSMILSSTFVLILQLGLLLILLTAGLLFFINRYHISRINHLSEQINDFSTTRAYDTVDSIRSYPYGQDEIKTLAENTADMIKELQQHEAKIAQTAQFKSDFLANMSHEIRTPMNAIVALSDLILKEDLPEQGEEYAKQINSSANAMLVIISDILDFSKIEAGTVEIVQTDYNIRQIVNEVVDNTSRGLNRKAVVMKLEITPDMPYTLHGDSARIRQVLNNVISNAVKFTKQGSININVDFKAKNDRKIDLMIRVADTGIGIMKQDYERIFESFSQINSKRNREVEGTGLGLAITQRLVTLMDGTIEVESEYGVGSVFKICIPQDIAVTPESKDRYIPLQSKPVGERPLVAPKAKVLVVDDNSVNLYVARNLMELFGINPTCVLSGQQALKAVEKDNFDLVFMDYMMPQMDGIETTKMIREKYPAYKNIPFIAFTANAVEEARDLLLKEGMDDFLSKPVKKEELEEALKKWLPESVLD